MGFRFRKSISCGGLGRLNFGNRGMSVSVGSRGNTVNVGRNGVRHTVGIPGSGLSYSYKMAGGGSGRRRGSQGPTMTDLERQRDELVRMYRQGEAELAVHEAKYQQVLLGFEQHKAGLKELTPLEQAELDIANAEQEKANVELEIARETQEDIRRSIVSIDHDLRWGNRAMRGAGDRRTLFWVIVIAVIIMAMSGTFKANAAMNVEIIDASRLSVDAARR